MKPYRAIINKDYVVEQDGNIFYVIDHLVSDDEGIVAIGYYSKTNEMDFIPVSRLYFDMWCK